MNSVCTGCGANRDVRGPPAAAAVGAGRRGLHHALRRGPPPHGAPGWSRYRKVGCYVHLRPIALASPIDLARGSACPPRCARLRCCGAGDARRVLALHQGQWQRGLWPAVPALAQAQEQVLPAAQAQAGGVPARRPRLPSVAACCRSARPFIRRVLAGRGRGPGVDDPRPAEDRGRGSLLRQPSAAVGAAARNRGCGPADRAVGGT